jgi:hypothetical protein
MTRNQPGPTHGQHEISQATYDGRDAFLNVSIEHTDSTTFKECAGESTSHTG